MILERLRARKVHPGRPKFMARTTVPGARDGATIGPMIRAKAEHEPVQGLLAGGAKALDSICCVGAAATAAAAPRVGLASDRRGAASGSPCNVPGGHSVCRIRGPPSSGFDRTRGVPPDWPKDVGPSPSCGGVSARSADVGEAAPAAADLEGWQNVRGPLPPRGGQRPTKHAGE